MLATVGSAARGKLGIMQERPEIRYSTDGLSVAVRWPGDTYWYRFDHPTVDTPKFGPTFRCVPGTFDNEPHWLDPFAQPRLRVIPSD